MRAEASTRSSARSTRIPETGPCGSRSSKSWMLLPFGATTPIPVTTTRELIRKTPIPDTVPEQTTVPSSSVISACDRKLAATKKDFLCRNCDAVWPGFDDSTENSTAASVNRVITFEVSASLSWANR